jgi:hypothetical protein
MALRSSTISMPFSSDQSQEQIPEQYGLLRKLVILLLLVASSSLWLFVLFREKKLVYTTGVQELVAGICIAIIAGLGAQLVMSKRDGFFRFVAAMTGDVAGIYLLGFISGGKYGISQFGWLPKAMDYDGLNLIGIGFVIILFISLLFRRTRIVVIPEPISSMGEPEISSPMQIEPSNPGISVSNPVHFPRISLPAVSWPRFLTSGAVPASRSNGRSTGLIQPAKVKPAVASKKRRRRGKPRVQLALVEEHRCPYCLDLVARSDPRGVVECKVCRSLHHKDCWDVTGSCQVPHLNT